MDSVRVHVDLSALEAAVRQMGAGGFSRPDPVDLGAPEWQPLDDELLRGKEVKLEELDVENGLLALDGRQVALYIPDHGWRVQAALDDGARGKRIHVADCQTLREMRERGRFERYVVTTSTGPGFPISGHDEARRAIQGDALLRACKNCLKFLRYRGYTGGNSPAWKDFSLAEFYETYRTFFPVMPRRWAGSREDYSSDWSEVSERYRASKSWTCEECRVDLSDDHSLLHAHHKNGVKSDNRRTNLKAVCCLCHRREPDHAHLRVSPKDQKRVQRLREQQGILRNPDWRDVRRFADPGVEGALDRLQTEAAEIPELGVQTRDGDGRIVAEPELAYPRQRVGIAISPGDRTGMKGAGWRAHGVHEITDPHRPLPDSVMPRRSVRSWRPGQRASTTRRGGAPLAASIDSRDR